MSRHCILRNLVLTLVLLAGLWLVFVIASQLWSAALFALVVFGAVALRRRTVT